MQRNKRALESDIKGGFFSSFSFKQPQSKIFRLSELRDQDLQDKMNIVYVSFEKANLVWVKIINADLYSAFLSKLSKLNLLTNTIYICQNVENFLCHEFLMADNIFNLVMPLVSIPSEVINISDEDIQNAFVSRSTQVLEKLKQMAKEIIEGQKSQILTTTKEKVGTICSYKGRVMYKTSELLIKRVSYQNAEFVWVDALNESLGDNLKRRLINNKDFKYSLYTCEKVEGIKLYSFLLPEVILKKVLPNCHVPKEVSMELIDEHILRVFTPQSPDALNKAKKIATKNASLKKDSLKIAIYDTPAAKKLRPGDENESMSSIPSLRKVQD